MSMCKIEIDTLIDKIKSTTKTPDERKYLLIEAKILTETGEYHPDFFSKETIENDRLYREQN